MNRTSIAIFSVLAASSAALAQTQQTPPPTSPPPAATDRTAGTNGQAAFHTPQKGEFSAGDMIGATVRNAANENIGEVEELVVSPEGQVMAVVVGVGGFLGIGQHDVAVSFKSVRIERDTSAMTKEGSFIVRVNATKETLRNAPEWKDPTMQSEPRGSGGSPSPKK